MPLFCDCGNECAEIGPKVLAEFRIPFTQIEVRIWDWAKAEYDKECVECFTDRQAEYQGFDAALAHAYEQGQMDGYRH